MSWLSCPDKKYYPKITKVLKLRVLLWNERSNCEITSELNTTQGSEGDALIKYKMQGRYALSINLTARCIHANCAKISVSHSALPHLGTSKWLEGVLNCLSCIHWSIFNYLLIIDWSMIIQEGVFPADTESILSWHLPSHSWFVKFDIRRTLNVRSPSEPLKHHQFRGGV